MTTAFEIASARDTYQAFGVQRVDNPYSVVNTLGRAAEVRTTPRVSSHATAVDTTALSGAGALIAAAVGDSDVRLDRIASLRQSIADGTYEVSADAVAGAVLGSLTVR